jgi:CheY-like chemotaxis protein
MQPEAAGGKREMQPEATGRKRVVLADDDDDWRELLAASLEGAGYEVTQAADGRELKTMLEAAGAAGQSPDLVVSDHLMPFATGLEVLAWATQHAPAVPFVLMSAFVAPHIRHPALRLGAAAVIDKPVGVEALRARLVELLDPSRPG